MAVDKAVDSTRLDGAMTATANKIREKTEKTDLITWDPETGFSAALAEFPDADVIPDMSDLTPVLVTGTSGGATLDKVVDSAQLNQAMIATANTIRQKTGSAELITWDLDTGFAAAIEGLSLVKLVSISITTAPTKTAYKAGETFSTAGMVVTATYSDGTSQVCTGYSVSPSGTLRAGMTSVTIQYTEDGITVSATQTISVTKTSVAIPYQSGSLTYSGNSQSPAWTNYNTSYMSISGTTSGTNAGSYTATFTLVNTDWYQWSDGTTATKSIAWSIGKAAGKITLNKTSIALSASAKSVTFTVTRNGTGKITATSDNTSVAAVSPASSTSTGTVTFTVTSVNDTNGSAAITIVVAADTNYTAPANATISVSAVFVSSFGVCWDYSNSSTALSRLTAANDPNGLVNTSITTEPSPALGTGSGSSPFDSYLPWKGMEEYNIIDNAVSYKKGASGFSRTSYDTVVYIPEFYYKIVDDATNSKRYFYIADSAMTGFTKHPGSGRYVGKYHTISGYYSKSGSTPLTSITRATARTNSRAKGSNWCQYDFATYCAIVLLYLVEFADWDSQSKVGYGCGSGSKVNNGGCDSMTYHTGTSASARSTAGPVQYRNIEGLWSNVYDWVDGINFSARAGYICTDPDNYADDTSTNYTTTGITLPSSNGYITKMGYSSAAPWAMIPSSQGGSSTTYVPDYVYSSSGWRVLIVGGRYNAGAGLGLLYFVASNDSSSSYDYVGARLLYIP